MRNTHSIPSRVLLVAAATTGMSLVGCGPEGATTCSPPCERGFVCYYGVCLPVLDPDANQGDGGDGGGPRDPGKLDLLFVIDNSPGMEEAQRMLVQAFPLLLDALFSPPRTPTGHPEYPPVEDLHVGVISSDMGAGGHGVTGCQRSDNGRLQHRPAEGVSGCQATYPPYLALSGADREEAVHDFRCIAMLGEDGCGFEQPLAALRRALTDHMRPGGPDVGFLRPDAGLAVVILSNENDCSSDDPSVYDPGDPTPLGARCVRYADRLTAVQSFVEALEGAKPGGPVGVAFVIGTHPSVGACNTTGDRIAPCLSHETMQERLVGSETVLSVESVCESGGIEATPGVRFVALAAELGERAIVRSICDPRYETLFPSFARLVQAGR